MQISALVPEIFKFKKWLKYTNEMTEAGRKIAPNTGANATKFFTLATKS